MTKTTPKHVEQYKRTFATYQANFGLMGWSLYFERRPSEANGWIKLGNLPDRVATVGLATEIDTTIKFIAKHEALELLFARYQRLAELCSNVEILDEERHAIIRTLEKIIP